MERDKLIQMLTLIIAVVALILALFSVVVSDGEEDVDNPENEIPTAKITLATTTVEEMESLLFDASGSTDLDGTIVEYSWDFGDGEKDSGMYTNHAYSTTGTFTVTLTVRDNDGETATATSNITINAKPANVPPVASILLSATSTYMYEHVNCDGSSSSDSDGEIVMYLWEFGDGTNSSGIYSNHIYTSPATFTITLTVTDDHGAKNSTSGIIVINDPGGPPGNNPPNAVISVDQFTIKEDEPFFFNASGSSDPDGIIVEYAWNFDDGTGGAGIYNEHTFLEIGEYNVTLTVYDNDGASDTDHVIITVESNPPTGEFWFNDDYYYPYSGNYTGVISLLSMYLPLEEAYIYIEDASSGNNETQNPIESGIPLQVGSGLKLTYNDSSSNGEIDWWDQWTVENGSHGDIIRLLYKNGETVAEYTLTLTTPTGALSFTEHSPGNYSGGIISLSNVVLFSDASLFIEDNSTGINETQIPIQSGVPFQAGSGMTLEYTDSNGNGKLDAGDVWTIGQGAAGDVIKLMFIPKGELIAEYILA